MPKLVIIIPTFLVIFILLLTTGMTKGKVPPENIISIEEIKGYIQMQEKYPDYVEFYNEIE